MFELITKPMVWIVVIMVGLIFWWVIIRLAFRAYYKSRLEFHKEYSKRRKEHESDTEKPGGTPSDG
jgi:uncharacterized membrane protein (DUF106 family)